VKKRYNKEGIEELRSKLERSIALRRGISFRINRILDHTELEMCELAKIFTVSEASVYEWSKGTVLPHEVNRNKIEKIYTQRKDGKIYLADEDVDLINNPRPLRKYNKRKKIQKDKTIKPLNKIELAWVNSSIRNWLLK